MDDKSCWCSSKRGYDSDCSSTSTGILLDPSSSLLASQQQQQHSFRFFFDDNHHIHHNGSFPLVVACHLTKAESDRYSHICHWKLHGRSFCVLDRDLFVTHIMPLYFRQSQFASFQRQLNLYGLERLSRKYLDCFGVYCHPHFVWTHPELCRHVQRHHHQQDTTTTTTKSKKKKSSSTTTTATVTEQDLAQLPPMPDIGPEHMSNKPIAFSELEPPNEPAAAAILQRVGATTI